MPTYPTAEATTVLVAEIIRQEQGGKMTIIGLYPDADVVFTPPAVLPATVQLAVAFIFKDGEGEFRVNARVLEPDGKSVAEINLGNAVKKPGEPHSIVLQISTFIVNTIGTYAIVVSLNDHTYRAAVSFRQGG